MAAATASPKKKTRILSIDGGGIRGIIPGQILVRVEEKLKEFSGDESSRIADYFDLIAGTSTGGILACIYLYPRKRGSKRPHFTAEQAVELYMDHGDEIFELSLWQQIKSGKGVLDEKYSARNLERELKDKLDDLWLSDLVGPCMVTAYDIERRQTKFFIKAGKDEPAEDFRVRDVARSTSAAPTYFEAAMVKARTGTAYALVDGGVFANNPTLCAYAEARKMRGKPTASQMAILSLGTGHHHKEEPYPYRKAKDWGLAEWAKPVLSIMMTGVSETVDYQLRKMFDAAGVPSQYLRIDPRLMKGGPDTAMDNASEENMKKLASLGREAAQDHDRDLTTFIQSHLLG